MEKCNDQSRFFDGNCSAERHACQKRNKQGEKHGRRTNYVDFATDFLLLYLARRAAVIKVSQHSSSGENAGNNWSLCHVHAEKRTRQDTRFDRVKKKERFPYQAPREDRKEEEEDVDRLHK